MEQSSSCYGKLCVSSWKAEKQWRIVILHHFCCFLYTSLTPLYDNFCFWVGGGKITLAFCFSLFTEFSIFNDLRNMVIIPVCCIHILVLFDIPDTRNRLFLKKWNNMNRNYSTFSTFSASQLKKSTWKAWTLCLKIVLLKYALRSEENSLFGRTYSMFCQTIWLFFRSRQPWALLLFS